MGVSSPGVCVVSLASLGKIIAEKRQDREWSQRRLLKQLALHGFQCSDGYIGRVETGASSPSKQLLLACERAFGMETGELLCYAILAHTEDFCSKTGITVEQYLVLINRAR